MRNAGGAQFSWATCLKSRVSPRLRLFCFPYLGGGTWVFRQWPDGLPADVEVWAVQLPGRERRIAEAPIGSMATLAERAVAGLAPLLTGPYAFFGYSMGATVSFEVARRLRLRPPVKLIVSAQGAPQLASPRELARHRLSDPDLIDEISRLGGTPPEVLENRELLDLLLPVLRTDFEALDTYTYTPQPPLSCPIAAYGGTEDAHVPLQHIEAWREQTTAAFRSRLFDGGHFFLNTHRAELLAELQRDLAPSS
ncbi:MAG TPA: alpha/beta fold hydrolase [Thermoanaerobaculia bacterium]